MRRVLGGMVGARLAEQIAAAVREGAAVRADGVVGREVLQRNGLVGGVLGMGHCSDQAPTMLSRRHAGDGRGRRRARQRLGEGGRTGFNGNCCT